MKQRFLIITVVEVLLILTTCSSFHVLSNAVKKTVMPNYSSRCRYYLSQTIQPSTKNNNLCATKEHNDVQCLETTTTLPDSNDRCDKKDPAIRFPDGQATATTVWKDCLVPHIWQSQFGMDQSIRWSADDNLNEVAYQLLSMLGVIDTTKQVHLQCDLVKSMTVFTKFCDSNLVTSPRMIFKARIVCSRGQIASSKCPRWHIDHVPVRWIQSLVGPGVMWVNADAVLWNNFATNNNYDNNNNGDDDYGNIDRIDYKSATIYQAKEGEAIMLKGNRWNKFSSTEKIPYPIVHKSPIGLLPWDGRVLFTMDVEFH